MLGRQAVARHIAAAPEVQTAPSAQGPGRPFPSLSREGYIMSGPLPKSEEENEVFVKCLHQEGR